MTRLLLASLLFVPAASAQTARDNTVRRRDPQPPATFWMKRYPIRRHALRWHIDLEVSDFDRSYRQVRKFIGKFEGEDAGTPARDPKDTVKYQQFSVGFSRKNAERIVKRLRRLGKIRREKTVELLHPEVPGEAATKLAQLEMERAAGDQSLKAFFSLRAALGEIIDHLRQATEAYESSKDRVLLNIVLEQK
jgi:hypothetical protein